MCTSLTSEKAFTPEIRFRILRQLQQMYCRETLCTISVGNDLVIGVGNRKRFDWLRGRVDEVFSEKKW